MEPHIRPARLDEMEEYGAIAAYVYAGRFGDTSNNLVSQSTHPDWTLCAFVDGRIGVALQRLSQRPSPGKLGPVDR